MKKVKNLALITMLFTMVIATVLYLFFPDTLAKTAINMGRSAAELELKFVQVDDHKIAYLEGGTGETIVFLHGFGVDKESWVQLAGILNKKYRVIISDIAGFGDSSKLPEANYGLESQVKRIDRFVTALKLDRFHIAGNSMGGMFAAVYAADFPQKVASVILLAPAGVKSPHISEVFEMIQKGTNLMLINSRADYDRVISLCFVLPPSMPEFLKDYFTRVSIANRKFNEKIMNDLFKTIPDITPSLAKISAPTLIIWGDRDKFLDVSTVPVMEKYLRNNHTVILNNVGHAPMMEKPEETALIFASFLR